MNIEHCLEGNVCWQVKAMRSMLIAMVVFHEVKVKRHDMFHDLFVIYFVRWFGSLAYVSRAEGTFSTALITAESLPSLKPRVVRKNGLQTSRPHDTTSLSQLPIPFVFVFRS